jgi:hypothetical protein
MLCNVLVHCMEKVKYNFLRTLYQDYMDYIFVNKAI